MLTAEQIAALRDAAGHLTDPINDFLLEDIARRIADAGQLTSSAAYQVWKLQTLGRSQRQIKKELRKRLKVSKKEINRLLTQSAEVGYRFDLDQLPTSAAIPFEKNSSIQQIVAAAVKLAEDDFTNLTQTIGMVDPHGNALPLQEVYRSCTDYAFQQVITGATDYNTAIRRATAKLAEHGVLSIDYESGVHTSLEAAVRRNIMGGLGLMQEQISEKNHDELGADGWELSAHANSAPDHEPFQGKQYTDKEYKALNGSLHRRIGTLNCGHVAFPIILGVNEPQYTAEQLERFRQDNEKGITFEGRHYTGYEATQMQRKMERAIRKQKRRVLIDEASGDKEKLLTDQIKLQRYKQEYSRFSKAAGLRTEDERLHVAGFGRKQAAQAVADVKKQIAKEKQHQKNLQFIEDDATIKAASGLPKKLENLPDEQLQHTVNVNIEPSSPGAFQFYAVAPKGADMTKVEVMAGFGTCTPIRDLRRLYTIYGRNPEGWQKKSGTAYGKEYHYVIHWYEHNGFIPENEIKLKGMKKNK